MWKKLMRMMNNTEEDLKKRMLRSIILVGEIACLFACVEIVLVMEVSAMMLTILVFLFLFMIGIFFMTFKYQKYEMASTLLGGVIVFLVMPPMFVLSGGIESGASVWLALGVLYIFIMFNGKKMYFFLIGCALTYAWTYYYTYTYPHRIVPMPSREIAHFDAWFSVLVVGTIGGVILKTHMNVFEKEHELNLHQKEELQKNQNARNVFFANMSHEIRTPINTIIGLNEMIMRENMTGQTREYARDIQIAGNMLLNQVNDILDFSQMEIDKMHMVPVKYKTVELFGDLIELVRLRMSKKNLDLYLDIDPNLPQVLYGDEKRLKQVFLNLLDNAVKYTQEGSVTFSVQSDKIDDENIYLKVKIEDTGIGIRNEDLEYIYDSFARVDEKKNRKVMGTGLGLSITRQLVNLMGGGINVDSIYTKGTVFTIIIPQRVVESTVIGNVDFMKLSVKDGEKYVPEFEAPEARILVVDDSNMNTMVTSKLLEDTKVQIDIAISGAEALKMTKRKFYHVILLDYMMPDMDGVQTLKEIRSQENGLCRESAMIVLTGNTVSGARKMYEEQGFNGYVEKPIQGKLLEKEIFQFLPAEIIEYQSENKVPMTGENIVREITRVRKKKICITTDCACDLSPELLQKYGIEIMYLYIRTPYGRFADTREIDSDNLTQYISEENSEATTAAVTREEYEEFFADMLTKAEQVIHFALSSRSGKSYKGSVEAAKGFDHVQVIDSGQVSGGQALIVLYAAKLATEGRNAEEICEEVEKMKARIRMRFIMPAAYIFSQNGRAKMVTAKICKMLQLHPMGEVRQGKATLTGLLGGSLENARIQGIRWSLRNKKKICKDIIYVTHVGCSVKELEKVKKEILRCIPFEKVVFQKASFTTACNAGIATIGFAFFENK